MKTEHRIAKRYLKLARNPGQFRVFLGQEGKFLTIKLVCFYVSEFTPDHAAKNAGKLKSDAKDYCKEFGGKPHMIPTGFSPVVVNSISGS
jgi:hypothetical protein